MTLSEFKQGNRDKGLHYFDRNTMRFFASRIVATSWRNWSTDGYFITSEQFRGSQMTAPRKWSIRRGNLETFAVDSVGEFQGYPTLRAAQKELTRLRSIETEKSSNASTLVKELAPSYKDHYQGA